MISAEKLREAQKTRFQFWLANNTEHLDRALLTRAKKGEKDLNFQVPDECDLGEIIGYFGAQGYKCRTEFWQEAGDIYLQRLESRYSRERGPKRSYWKVTLEW